jgi:cell division protein ZapA (FtsZ GTPase activity inhibitor)
VAGLLAVLNKEEAKAHIATLNLTEEVAALTEKNADFEAVFNKKLQEEVERLPQKDIDTEELRKQVDEKYAEIVQTVNAYAIVQPTEAIEAFIAQMNALISLTKPGSSSGSSSGGSTSGSTDTEPEPTPDPEPTPEPDPTPTPDPDTGEEDDDEGGLAG